MKCLSVLLVLSLSGCSDKNGFSLSRDQTAIENMADSFAAQYKSASAESVKDSVLKKYHTKIGSYLLDHYMNHIRVHVDSMRVDSSNIIMRFHGSGNVAYAGSLTLSKHMPRKEDSLLHFMEGLKPGTDTSLDFVYLGKIELNPPNDSLKPVLLIHALPISFQKHAL
jgi:hypothetical protein